MNYYRYNHTVQGKNHKTEHKTCQDYSKSFFRSKDKYHNKEYYFIAVADGHGSNDCFRSNIGSEFAAESAFEAFDCFINNINNIPNDQDIKYLEGYIISIWDKKVSEHYINHKFTEKELSKISEKAKNCLINDSKGFLKAYGTTLIACAVCNNFWFGIHIGDGKCVIFDNNKTYKTPIPWDNNCFLNITTSICDTNAIEHFRHYIGTELPAGIFICSDGIDDSFANPEGNYTFQAPEGIKNLYNTIMTEFRTDYKKAEKELDEYLPKLSEKGSGDDISLAFLLKKNIHSKKHISKNKSKKQRNIIKRKTNASKKIKNH